MKDKVYEQVQSWWILSLQAFWQSYSLSGLRLALMNTHTHTHTRVHIFNYNSKNISCKPFIKMPVLFLISVFLNTHTHSQLNQIQMFHYTADPF